MSAPIGSGDVWVRIRVFYYLGLEDVFDMSVNDTDVYGDYY